MIDGLTTPAARLVHAPVGILGRAMSTRLGARLAHGDVWFSLEDAHAVWVGLKRLGDAECRGRPPNLRRVGAIHASAAIHRVERKADGLGEPRQGAVPILGLYAVRQFAQTPFVCLKSAGKSRAKRNVVLELALRRRQLNLLRLSR